MFLNEVFRILLLLLYVILRRRKYCILLQKDDFIICDKNKKKKSEHIRVLYNKTKLTKYLVCSKISLKQSCSNLSRNLIYRVTSRASFSFGILRSMHIRTILRLFAIMCHWELSGSHDNLLVYNFQRCQAVSQSFDHYKGKESFRLFCCLIFLFLAFCLIFSIMEIIRKEQCIMYLIY